MADEEMSSTYKRQVGQRLRAIRRQKGQSLQDVEVASDHEFKASVLGAYERGERAISVPRLQRLARFYHVPVDQLLPEDEESPHLDLTDRKRDERKVRIDLGRLELLDTDEAQMLTRYFRTIQVQRQDFNGRVLTIRDDDLRAIAAILGVPFEVAADTLDKMGLRLPV
jgi:transcriptional regulator with XRE-family HTH domain